MTAFLASLSSCPRDFKLAFGFLTRVPGPFSLPAASGELGRALRLAPLVGLVVGVCGALVTSIAVGGLGLPPLPAAALGIDARREHSETQRESTGAQEGANPSRESWLHDRLLEVLHKVALSGGGDSHTPRSPPRP